MWRVMLLLWGAVALGAGPVEVEGERVKLDAKEFGTKAPVEVVYRLYTATRGPDKVLVCVGYVTSNLPTEWWDVTVKVRAWNTFSAETFPAGIVKALGEAAVTFKAMKPGLRTRFLAFVKDGEKFHGVNMGLTHFSTVETSWQVSEAEPVGKKK